MGDNIRDRERKIWISRCVTRERERVRMWLVRGKHMCVIKRERERERAKSVRCRPSQRGRCVSDIPWSSTSIS